MLRDLMLYLSESRLARRLAREAPFSHAVARRFVAGESLEDAVRAERSINEAGMHASLDYLGESVSNRDGGPCCGRGLRGAHRPYCRARGSNANVSLKLTQMGQDIDEAFLRENVEPRARRARESTTSSCASTWSRATTPQRTLDFFRRPLGRGVPQRAASSSRATCCRSEADVRRLNELGARVRLCKGAYKEPESVAFPRQARRGRQLRAPHEAAAVGRQLPGHCHARRGDDRATTDYARQKASPLGLRVPNALRRPARPAADRSSRRAGTFASTSPSARPGTPTTCAAWPSARPTCSSSSTPWYGIAPRIASSHETTDERKNAGPLP